MERFFAVARQATAAAETPTSQEVAAPESLKKRDRLSRSPSPSRRMRLEDMNELKVHLTAGQPIPYAALSEVFGEIEKESGRLKIQDLLTELFQKILRNTPEDLLPSLYLSTNTVAPEYEGVELGIGDSLLTKAICDATGRDKNAVKAAYSELGDLGLVAETSKSVQRMIYPPPPLTIRNVFQDFRSIAQMQGDKSQEKKVGVIKRLLVSSRGNESRYIIRALQGKLRIGLALQSILVALAHSVALFHSDSKHKPSDFSEAETVLKQVYSELPCFDSIVPHLISDGFVDLRSHCYLTPGIPVKPMLAKPTKGISEILDRFNGVNFTCEYKYDGMRGQIHLLPNGDIKIFSRNSEDNTSRYPDIISFLKSIIPKDVASFIIDSEVVAFDTAKKQILPFQILATRARKEVAQVDITVDVLIKAFDLIYFNGESLLEKPFSERRSLLHSRIPQEPGKLEFADHMESTSTDDIDNFLNESIRNSCEGLMVKTLTENASYEPSKRSLKWLKLKKDYITGLGDSVDLVPMGAYYGRGKRAGVYGAYLLSCYNSFDDEYQSICKIGTGFSDAILSELTKSFDNQTADRPPLNYVFDEGLKPDVWFKPCQVWEVKAADLSISPIHKAALGEADETKGIGLRFPRFIRKRDDKKPEEATNSTQIVDMYRNQAVIQNTAAAAVADDEKGAEDDDE